MKEIWCEHAWLGGEGVASGVLLEVEDGRIASVRDRVAAAPAGALVLSGYTLPGLANAHSHAFQRVFRGRTEAGRGDFWTWREQMYAAVARLDPDSYRELARATFGEMALAGITAVGEFHYVHHGPGGVPYSDPNAIGAALLEAAAEVGIRITLIDACYLHGGMGEEPNEGQRRFSDGTAERWAERVEAIRPGPRAKVGAAIHSIRALAPGEVGLVAGWAREREAPLHAHVSEQPAENEACLAAHGMTPTEVLAEAGALAAHFTAVHVTHPSEGDRRLLGEAEACCCLCPTTERDLADGIGRASLLRAEGATLAVGSDSQAVIDLFEECRAIELDERLATLRRGNLDAATLLRAATVEGQRAIGWDDAGTIAPGMLADLIGLDGESARLAGIDPGSALDSIVFAATAGDVSNVIVAGEPIVAAGRHLKIDVVGELRRQVASLAADG